MTILRTTRGIIRLASGRLLRIPASAGSAPVNVSLPILTGTGHIGDPLSVTAGVWTGAINGVSRDLLRGSVVIDEDISAGGGAAAPFGMLLMMTAISGGAGYTPTADDDGHVLYLRETARVGNFIVTVFSPSKPITYAPPAFTTPIADQSFGQGTGIHLVDATGNVTGSNLTWEISGPAGIGIDDGEISIPTTLAQSVSATVTISNSGGSAQDTFLITVAVAAPVSSGVSLPAQSFSQSSGTHTFDASVGFIGSGTYSLDAAPAGATINATTGVVSFTTGSTYSATTTTVRLTNTTNFATRTFTAAVVSAVTAPGLSGTALPDKLGLVRGTPATTQTTAQAFTGTIDQYSVTGAGVSINTATGILTFPKSATLAPQTVTVRATNTGTGGYAEATFPMSVAMKVIDPADVTIEIRPDTTTEFVTAYGAGAATWVMTVNEGALPETVTAFWWRGNEHVDGTGPGTGYYPCIKHPGHATDPLNAKRWIARALSTGSTTGAPALRPFLWANNPANSVIGQTKTHHFIWSASSLAMNPLTEMEFSGPSAAKTQVLTLVADTPPVTTGAPLSKLLPQATAAEKAVAGYVCSDGLQSCQCSAQSLSNPDICAVTQDSGGPWITWDHGRTWRRPTRKGLYAVQGAGIAIDPVNPLRMLHYSGGAFLPDYDGIYFSDDGMESFKLASGAVGGPVFSAGALNSTTVLSDGIAYAPASITATMATHWLAILTSEPARTPVVGISTDGGRSWTARGSFPTLKNVFPAGDPSNINTFWIGTGSGLYKLTGAFTGTWTVKLVQTGHVIYNAPYVSSSGQTIIYGAAGAGIFKSTDGGSTWARVGTKADFKKLHISPFNPNIMGTTKDGASATVAEDLPWLSNNGGTSFATPSYAQFQGRPGRAEGARKSACRDRSFLFFHTDPLKVAHFGRHDSDPQFGNENYWTDTFGQGTGAGNWGWRLDRGGYTGSNWKNPAAGGAAFDISNPDRYAMTFYDIGVAMTNDGGLSWTDPNSASLIAAKVAAGAKTGNPLGTASAVKPGTKIVVGAFGGYVDGAYSIPSYLTRSTDDGVTWSPISGGGGVVSGAFYDFADPDVLMWFNRRSTDGAWATFSVMAGLTSSDLVCGCTKNTSGTNAFFASDKGASYFKRTTDKGASWATALTMGYASQAGLGTTVPVFEAHPTNGNIVWTRDNKALTNGAHQIREWDLSSGTASTRPYVIRNIFGPAGTARPSGYPPQLQIDRIVADPRVPRVLYVALGSTSGMTPIWRTHDGGVTWTELIGRTNCFVRSSLAVHPVTGDCMSGGDQGTHVIPPPYKELSFSAGSGTGFAEGQTLTRGGVTGTVVRVILSSGTWGAGTAAGKVFVVPSGASFSAGTGTTSTGSATVTPLPDQTIFAKLPSTDSYIGRPAA